MLSVTAVVCGALLLVGCTSHSSGQSEVAPGYAGSSASQAPAADWAADGLIGGDMAGSDVAGSDASDSDMTGGKVVDSKAPVDRQVVSTGYVSVTVEEPVESADSAADIVEGAGGHVDERTEQPGTDTRKASAHLVLRIPSTALSETLTQLKKLGTVNNASMSATDVTTTVQDLDARITALQASVDRLLALMSTATDTTDLIAIETALSERQADLESLQARRTYLSDQVSLSTVTLDLVSEGTVAQGAPSDFWAGLLAGWNALVVAAGSLLVGFGVALPWLVVLALLACAAWLIARRSKRRKQQSANTNL